MFDVVLITGAAGTGKTSTAEAWTASRREVAAHLSHDNVLLFIKTGLASPAEQTTAEAERQWRIALTICCTAATIYAGNDIRCAIDTFLVPANLELWRGLSRLRVGLVVLHPSIETAVARNQARRERTGWGVPEWQVRANYDAMTAWRMDRRPLILDTTHLSLPQVVTAIDAWENRSKHTTLF
jgi:chloramphenicol 3-O-phosphotransferase